jgi:putative ABC transport system permease protein
MIFQVIAFTILLAIAALLLFIAGIIVARIFLGGVPYGYSVNNMTIRWRTTIASALAFMLVIALLIVMLAFVNAMSRLTKQSGQPGNVIVLSDGAIDELFSNLQYTETGDVERQPGVLRDEQNRLLCSRETYLVAIQDTGTVQDNRPARRFVQLRAIEDPLMAARVHGISLYPGGKWFSEAGVEDIPGTKEQAIQAVLGEGIAREIGHDRGKDTLRVGDLFELGGRKWIAVGITKSEGSTFGSEVWAKWNLVARLFGKERYTSIVLSTAGPAEAKALADQLTTSFKKAALQGMPETEYFARLDDTSKQFLGAIIFVTAIMSIGGIFGVMNTMFAAVSARKRDIGVLRIVGFARWQVLAVFLAESLLIALVGGALGCLLASFTDGWTANSIVSGGQGAGKFVALKLAVGIDALATGMVVALLMGALGGFFPAISAMRQRPLESLR